MKTEEEIRRVLNRLTTLKDQLEVWTDEELAKLYQVVHVLDARVYEQSNTVYTKAEIDSKFAKIQQELERRTGSW